MFFLVFHGKERFHHKPFPPEDDEAHGHDDHGDHTPHESPLVVTLPLVLLAIPSAVIGGLTIAGMLFGNFFQGSIFVDAARHPEMHDLAEHFHNATEMGVHAFASLPFLLALSGVVVAYVFYMVAPSIPAAIGKALSPVMTLMENKYYMDWINENIIAAFARWVGLGLWKGADAGLIDEVAVNGSARTVGWLAGVVRLFQRGYLYEYALVMIAGLLVLMTWFILFKYR
jgi:NADH-quinone oxidoreductase subunit L